MKEAIVRLTHIPGGVKGLLVIETDDGRLFIRDLLFDFAAAKAIVITATDDHTNVELELH